MNKRDQEVINFLNLYIIPVCAVIVLMILTVFLFFPKYESITTNLGNISTLDSNISTLNQNISRLDQAKTQKSYLDSSVTSFEVIVPTEARVSEVTAKLEQIARESKYGDKFFISAKAQENVDVKGNKILTGDENVNLPKEIKSIDLIVNVDGTLDKIHGYYDDITNTARLVTIKKIAWNSFDGNSFQAQFNLTAYYGDKILLNELSTKVEDAKLLNTISPLRINIDKTKIDEQVKKSLN